MTLVEPRRTPTPLFADDLGLHGDRPALLTAEGTLSYAELEDRVTAAADRLGPHRRLVLIEAGNAVEPLVAYLAALRGRHPVLLASTQTSAGLLDRYDPDVVVAAASGWDLGERRRDSAHGLHPDLALLLSTSGTTGSPKLVRLSHDNLAANAASIAAYLEITDDDRAITTLPLQYSFGLSVVNSHLLRGASLVLNDLSVLDRCFWERFEASGATSLAGVPHTFTLLDRVGFEDMALPSLRTVIQAGGRLEAEAVRRYAAMGQQRGWRFFVMYGQTEATARMAYLPPALAAAHPTAVGIAVPGGSLRIDTPDAGGVGELVYRGPNVMLGYAEAAGDLARGRSVHELRTGDLGRVGEGGLFELTGRRSRFVKLYGLRVDIDELEKQLRAAGLVALCTAADAGRGDEELVVALERGGPAAAAATTATAEAVITRFGLPRTCVRIVVLDALPLTVNGKPDHAALVRLAASPRPPAVATPANPLPAVRAAFLDILGVEPDDEQSFVGMGGDSLSYVEMSIRLEDALGCLPPDWHTTPIGALVPSTRRVPRLGQVETSVAVRAAAILLVVGTHTGLWHLTGGAHALLAVAGFNFARFQLRGRSMWGSVARIALPSVGWIAVVAATTDLYGWQNAALVNGLLRPSHLSRGYWYIEALVQILVPLAIVFRSATLRRLEQRWPFGLPVIAASGALLARVVGLGADVSSGRFIRPQEIFWIFLLGWAAARATTVGRRVAVSGLAVASVPGFFGSRPREAVVLAALLAVVWMRTVPVPRPLVRPIGVVAGASLSIYLTHWQVFRPLSALAGPGAAFVGSVVVGIAGWLLVRRIIRTLRTRVGQPRGSSLQRPDAISPVGMFTDSTPGTV